MSPQSAFQPGTSTSQLRHDLRTPLNHILGYSEMLLDDHSGQSVAPLLQATIAESREMLACVQRLLIGNEACVSEGTYQNLHESVRPIMERIEDRVRKIRENAPAGTLPDVERIGVAAARLRAIIAGPAVETPSRTTAAQTIDPATVTERVELTDNAKGRILVVDDNDLNRDMLSRQLIRQNHQVDTASDGADAIEMLRARHYDILLLDVLMPGMNGFQVLEKVKRDVALQSVAVIVVSALDELDSAIRCIELGAEDYLFKPVNPTLLRARIRSTLDRIRSEEALRRRQKFESIGMLAAGVAHDFNNLLTGIIGNGHLLRQALANPGDRQMADAIVNSGERAAELIRQLLAYAGKGMRVVKPLGLSLLVNDTEGLIRASLPGKAELKIHLRPVPEINADANQLRQALLNLTINAAEALESAGANCVSIETGIEKVSKQDRFDLRPEEIAEGDYVFLEVSDTGCGIAENAFPKLFEPFYSTKFLGRGLGLAAVAGIIRSHGGMLRLMSSVGKGSSFRIYFPAIPSANQESPTTEAPCILVVDDESVIRQIAKLALERSGYQVLLADSGASAIQLFESNPSCISVVVLDLRMPAMDGADVLQQMQTIQPEAKIIVSSGLSRSEVESQLKRTRVAAFLQKPYKITELVQRVEECIATSKMRNH